LDAAGHSDYFARSTLRDLAAQYFRYGRWKAQMVKLHPRSIRFRQVVSPALVAYLIFFGLLSMWWAPALWLLLPVAVIYALLSYIFGFMLARNAGDWRLLPLIPIVFFLIHTTWGVGFLTGLIRSPR